MAYLQLKKESRMIQLKAWIKEWEPRTKLIAAILFLIGVVSLVTVPALLISFTSIYIAALSMGLSNAYMMKRLALILPFLLFMSLPLLFGGGWPIATERIELVLLISFKALTSILIMLIMLRTQSEEELFSALAHLPIPDKLLTIFYLSYRYVFILLLEIKQTFTAITSRLFQERLSIKGIKTYGHIIAGLIIKAIDLSENVHKALSSRCFQGKLIFGGAKAIYVSDMIKAVLPIILILLLLIMERIFIL